MVALEEISEEHQTGSSVVIETEEPEKNYWQRRGEAIGTAGLICYPLPAREILSRLKEAGYYVGSYNHLSPKKQKELLRRKRQEIECMLAKYLPAVLKSIKQRNFTEFNRYSRFQIIRR